MLSPVHAPDFQLDLEGGGGSVWAVEVAGDGGGVVVVTTSGDFDVAFVGDDVVGGVEAEPAFARDVDLAPGVGGLGTTQLGLRTVVEIAAHITRWDAEGAADADHEMREVLADAAFRGQNLVHVGGDFGAVRRVGPLSENVGHHRFGDLEDIVAPVTDVDA